MIVIDVRSETLGTGIVHDLGRLIPGGTRTVWESDDTLPEEHALIGFPNGSTVLVSYEEPDTDRTWAEAFQRHVDHVAFLPHAAPWITNKRAATAERPDPADFTTTHPDWTGTPATSLDLLVALHQTGRARDHEMTCPRTGCDGRVEAGCGIWFTLGSDGFPHLHGIGWFEGGTVTCSLDGRGHIPRGLRRQIDATLSRYCAQLETELGANCPEARLPHPTVGEPQTGGGSGD